MARNYNAILISEIDDVATAITDLQPGDIGRYALGEEIAEVVITEKIPKFHKFALRVVPEAGLVRKYGEPIGVAIREIRAGSHVHDHNIVSPVRRDRQKSGGH